MYSVTYPAGTKFGNEDLELQSLNSNFKRTKTQAAVCSFLLITLMVVGILLYQSDKLDLNGVIAFGICEIIVLISTLILLRRLDRGMYLELQQQQPKSFTIKEIIENHLLNRGIDKENRKLFVTLMRLQDLKNFVVTLYSDYVFPNISFNKTQSDNGKDQLLFDIYEFIGQHKDWDSCKNWLTMEGSAAQAIIRYVNDAMCVHIERLDDDALKQFLASFSKKAPKEHEPELLVCIGKLSKWHSIKAEMLGDDPSFQRFITLVEQASTSNNSTDQENREKKTN